MYHYTITITGKIDTIDQAAQATNAAHNLITTAYDSHAIVELTTKKLPTTDTPASPTPQGE